MIDNDGFGESRVDAEKLRTLTQEQTGGELAPTGSGAQALMGPSDWGVPSVDIKPRNVDAVLAELKVLGGAAGDSWFYRYPVKDQGQTKWIEGPTIKCANDVLRIYGNCAVDIRAFDQGNQWLFYARFVDYEKNVSMVRAFQQSKNQTTIKTKDMERSMSIAFQIGQSKAIRNVITNALQTFADYAFQSAKDNMVEKIGKKLPEYRAKIAERLDEMEIPLNVVERHVGKAKDEWLAHDVARIIGEIQAIQDGMSSATEVYPDQGGGGERPIMSREAAAARPGRSGGRQEPYALIGDGGEIVNETTSPEEFVTLGLVPMMVDEVRDFEAVWESNRATVDKIDAEGFHALANKARLAYESLRTKADGTAAETASEGSGAEAASGPADASTEAGSAPGTVTAGLDASLVHGDDVINRSAWTDEDWMKAREMWIDMIGKAKGQGAIDNIEAITEELLNDMRTYGRGMSATQVEEAIAHRRAALDRE